MTHQIYTVIAPYGTVTGARDAGGDMFGDGRKLEGGGVAWDLPALPADTQTNLEAAGAKIYERREGEYLSDVVERAGYTLEPTDTTI
jgi:hypothetical protein